MLVMYPTAAMDGSGIHDDKRPVNSHQLQQQELVSFLYQRFRFGFFITLFVVVVAYVFWPGNRRKFEDAAQLPFETGDATDQNGKS